MSQSGLRGQLEPYPIYSLWVEKKHVSVSTMCPVKPLLKPVNKKNEGSIFLIEYIEVSPIYLQCESFLVLMSAFLHVNTGQTFLTNAGINQLILVFICMEMYYA